MRKLTLSVLSAYVTIGLAFAQAGNEGAKSSGAADAVRQLEHDWIDAMKAGDADKLGQIIADDWTGLSFDGKTSTKKSYLAELKSGTSKIESFDFGPMDVKVLGNVAVVQGSDTEKSVTNGKTTSGKWVWMDVFVKRGDKWLAVRSQSAMVK
jgi:ketosteroid isomerase-like protein